MLNWVTDYGRTLPIWRGRHDRQNTSQHAGKLQLTPPPSPVPSSSGADLSSLAPSTTRSPPRLHAVECKHTERHAHIKGR